MIKLLGLAAALYLASPSLALAHPPTIVNQGAEQAIAEEVLEFRERMGEAIRTKDAAALRTMYAESFQHVHTSAKVDGRDTRIVSAIAGEPVIETGETLEMSVRAHAGGWAAVVTGLSPIKAMSDGKVYAVRWTAFYVRTDTSWQLAASQATRSHELKP